MKRKSDPNAMKLLAAVRRVSLLEDRVRTCEDRTDELTSDVMRVDARTARVQKVTVQPTWYNVVWLAGWVVLALAVAWVTWRMVL